MCTHDPYMWDCVYALSHTASAWDYASPHDPAQAPHAQTDPLVQVHHRTVEHVADGQAGVVAKAGQLVAFEDCWDDAVA